jgi:hypothetical protein
MELTASSGGVGIAGERRRPAARAPLDWRGREIPGGRRLVEKNQDVVAELGSFSEGRGVAGNGGDGEVWPARVCPSRAERRRGREVAKRGFSPGRRRPL